MAVVFDYAGLTDIGRVRSNNQDQFLIAELTKQLHIAQTSLTGSQLDGLSGSVMGHLLVVADGMGGAAGGELASGLALETISWYIMRTMPWFFRYQDGREQELEAELLHAVEACQHSVAEAAAGTDYSRMGTTLTLAYVLWPRLYVVHAGDSRCYLRRDKRFGRMTKDHTVAQRAIDEGLMTEEEAKGTVLGNTLWNCIGGGTENVSPDIFRATLRPGDELLLCTDGLTRKLRDRDIRDILAESKTSEDAARALVYAANEAGGEDNITVIVARVRPTGPKDITPPNGTAVLEAL